MTLYFSNPGLLPIEAITTLGVNAKLEGGSPIGQFGTGAKYAIAGILRLGGTLRIELHFSGGFVSQHTFCTNPLQIRGKDFDVVAMATKIGELPPEPSQPLGFTTALGSHWQPWMLYRELWSNARDEGGGVGTEEPGLPPGEEFTVVVVDCPKVEEVHQQSGQFILSPERRPLWSNQELEVYERLNGEIGVFYRGIRVTTTPREGFYTYNILTPQQLTEDRTLSEFYAAWAVKNQVVKCDDRGICEAIVTSKGWESGFNWEHSTGWSEEFKQAVRLKGEGELSRSYRKNYAEEFLPRLYPITPEQRQAVEVLQAKLPYWPWRDYAIAADQDWETSAVEGILWINRKLEGQELQLAVVKTWMYDIKPKEMLSEMELWQGEGE